MFGSRRFGFRREIKTCFMLIMIGEKCRHSFIENIGLIQDKTKSLLATYRVFVFDVLLNELVYNHCP